MNELQSIFYHATVIKNYDEEIEKLTTEYNSKIAKLTEWRNKESDKLFSDYFKTL